MKEYTIDENKHIIKNQTFKGERPLFKSSFVNLENCKFVEGESALKFATDINSIESNFSSKYLFWHNENLKVNNCNFLDGARASIWYSNGIVLDNCKVNSPKIFRDAKNITIKNCLLSSEESLWDCKDIQIDKTEFIGDYLLFHSNDININQFILVGNYSFQHTKNVTIRNVTIKSKDAFWNSENITVYDSIIDGEYLGWYSKNLKLVNCKIMGTQPLCYAQDLVLENCEMINTDLAFEESSLKATIVSSIDSVKNPLSGFIKAKEIKELILDEENKKIKIEIENK